MVGKAELDARDAVGDLAGDELDAAQRALVVEQDPGRRVQPEGLAIIHRHRVRVELGAGVRAARIERRALVLDRRLDQAVHLGGRRLVEARGGVDDTHRLQQVHRAEPGDGPGQQRLLPGGRDEALRREIVDLVGLCPLHHPYEGRKIGEIAVDQLDAVEHADPAQPLADHVRRGGAPQQAVHGVAAPEQQLGEVGAILPRDPGDEC